MFNRIKNLELLDCNFQIAFCVKNIALGVANAFCLLGCSDSQLEFSYVQPQGVGIWIILKEARIISCSHVQR